MSLDKLISNVNTVILNPLITLMFALATVYFLWNVYNFIKNGDKPDKRGEYANGILWGLIGMAIMIGAYTIIGILTNSFGISNEPIDSIRGI